MALTPDPGAAGTEAPFLSPWRLSVVALVLFALYGTIVLGGALPARVLDPAWQLRLIAALVDASAFPLVGLALLHLGADLDPDDPRLAARRRLCARLAVLAALGFLLLIPLQGMASWQQQSTTAAARAGELRRAEGQLDALRRAVDAATSPAELQRRLTALQGPAIGPAEAAQPLPLLQAQVRAVLQQAAQQIERQRQAAPPSSPWALLPGVLRNGLACFGLGLGFAALAQGRRRELPLLKEWQIAWTGMRQGILSRPRGAGDEGPRGRRQVDAAYFEALSRGDRREP